MEALPDAPTGPPVGLTGPDADSRRWLGTLGGPRRADRDGAVRDLHDLLLSLARSEAGRRAGTDGIRGPEPGDGAVVDIRAKLRRHLQARGPVERDE